MGNIRKKYKKKDLTLNPFFSRRAAAPLSSFGDFIFLLAWPRYQSSLSEAGPPPFSSCTQDSLAQLSPSPRHLPLAASSEPNRRCYHQEKRSSTTPPPHSSPKTDTAFLLPLDSNQRPEHIQHPHFLLTVSSSTRQRPAATLPRPTVPQL